MVSAKSTESQNGKRATLHEDENTVLRRYETGRYGLTVDGLRIIFSKIRVPAASNIYEFQDEDGKHIGSVRSTDIPHSLTIALNLVVDEDV